MSLQLNSILVVGAGTMGRGIAQWFAQQNCRVEMIDVDYGFCQESLEKVHASWDKLLSKNKFTPAEVDQFKKNLLVKTREEIDHAPDLLIEAIVEDLLLKERLFVELDEELSASTIFASNTSSFPITILAKDLSAERKEKFLGLHFFNPAPIMKLVEIITGEYTDTKLAIELKTWFATHSKKPALCQDSPGFIVNRVARNFYGESLRIANTDTEETYREIDQVLKSVGGFKMGPFELMDLIGIDINYNVTLSVWKAFYREARFSPHSLQKKMVDSHRLGKKTGRGFFNYE